MPPETKLELLDLAKTASDKNFTFLKLEPALTDVILDNLPDYFKFNLDETFFRLQLISQQINPHTDKGRKSGIYVMLTDNTACTKFYNWKKDAPRQVVNDYISNDQLDCKLSVVFPTDEVWLFDHAAIHSVDPTDTLRVSLNILYQHTTFDNLVKLYQTNCQTV